ncbi:epsin-3 isoform X2 [Amia ocellicauda]|uniref:epsin-3 isoform X2 n=1 Tax=Amia ocellicauda TaxID=2972642 RepID=UPI00346392F7|nr:EPN3 protein [Amia calva]
MTTSALRRQVKNIVHNYSEAEIKVREATSNDPWGPSSSLMSEISDLTFNVVAFAEVMGMLWKRLNDHGKNWRHVYKALTLLDYLLKTGSERVAQQCRENVFTVQTLRDFQYVDRDGKDQGVNVREKAKQLVALLRNEDRLKQERAHALKTKERMAGVPTGLGSGGSLPTNYPSRRTSQPTMASLYGEEHSRSRGSPSSFNSSSSSPRLASDLEQARPQTSGEEELQLQLALAMSREESEKPPQPAVEVDVETQLEIAMTLSQETPPQLAPALDMDEEMQLQIAMSLSREEHEKEQRSRHGDETLLQRALEESRRESVGGHGESALSDLVDIFGPVSAVHPSGDPWDLTEGEDQAPSSHPWTEPPCTQPHTSLTTSDPWDSVGARSTTPVTVSPWSPPPASSTQSQSWGTKLSPPDPWELPPGPSPSHPWISPAHSSDPFSKPPDYAERNGPERPFASGRSSSPAELDLFGEPLSGSQLNGRGGGSPDTFDLSHLGESLRGVPSPRTCRTPEAFLGPTAASLVNLDTLIPSNPPAKNRNPFLSGLSAPSPTNPFHSDQPRLTLNQLRPSSGSPQPGPLPYSASLPLPLSSHSPVPLPSSVTQPPPSGAPAFSTAGPGLLDLPGNLPQPLLPLSSVAPPASAQQDALSRNPFL